MDHERVCGPYGTQITTYTLLMVSDSQKSD